MRKSVKTKMMWIVGTVLAVVFVLLVSSGCYNRWARGVLRKRMSEVEREPNSGLLKGASPIRIEKGREKACLVLHGFMSSPVVCGELPRALDRAGWDVHAPLLKGHGTDPRDLRNVSAEDWIRQCGEEFENLKSRYNQVAVAGFSMGGALAVTVAAEHNPRALVLINPYFASTYRAYYLLPPRRWHALLHPFLDYAVAPGPDRAVSRPGGAAGVLRYRVIPTEVFGEVFAVADRARKARLGEVPLLMLCSEKDGTASIRAAKAFYRRARGPQQIETFERSKHLLLLDYGREEAIETILEFLNGLPGE
jgi:carboxylesterase